MQNAQPFGLLIKQEFEGLLQDFSQIPNLIKYLEEYPIRKEAIAFLVDAIGQFKPEIFQQEITSIKVKIRAKYSECSGDDNKALKQSAEILDEKITELYQIAIKEKIENPTSLREAEFYESLSESCNKMRRINKVLYQLNGLVSIGGINNAFIPPWYKNLLTDVK